MKQKVGFFETNLMKILSVNLRLFLAHAGEATMGFFWIGTLWLFVMFFYTLCFVYRPQA